MEPISSVLYAVFRGTPVHSEWILACLEGAWPALLGDSLSRVCRPFSFQKGELKIEVLDEAWMPAIEEVRAKLAGKIRAATGDEVKRISLRKAR